MQKRSTRCFWFKVPVTAQSICNNESVDASRLHLTLNSIQGFSRPFDLICQMKQLFQHLFGPFGDAKLKLETCVSHHQRLGLSKPWLLAPAF